MRTGEGVRHRGLGVVIAIHSFISLMLIQKTLIEPLPGAKHSEASLDTRPCLSSCPLCPGPCPVP